MNREEILERKIKQLERKNKKLMEENEELSVLLDQNSQELNSNYCPMTGLLNKIGLEEKISELKYLGRQDSELMVLMLDINGFRLYNERFKERGGNIMLIEIGDRFKKHFRGEDICGRYEADQFVIAGTINRTKNKLKHVNAIIDKTSRILSIPFDYEGHHISFSAKYGVSILSKNEEINSSLILSQTLGALKRSKKQEVQLTIYDSTNKNSENKIEFEILNDLPIAIHSKNQLFLNYQPQVNPKTGEIEGLEALIRWKHPQKGNISPGEFIPVAEQTGLISKLEQFVVEEVTTSISNWLVRDFKIPRISVNLSGNDFTYEFKDKIEEQMFNLSLPPEKLEIELTESTNIQEIEVLKDMKKLGVSLAHDDFGTGYSSMEGLVTLNDFQKFDTLKIDRAFIAKINNENDSFESFKRRSVIKSIQMLAKGYEMMTIAEGVETEFQKNVVENLGCELIQGFYYSRPLSKIEIENILLKDSLPEVMQFFN